MTEFVHKLGNAWEIFKTSLSFIRRDKSLLAVPILLVFTSLIFCVLFFFVLSIGDPTMALAFYANIIIFLFFMHLWTTFLGAAQAWMVHEVAQGKDTTLFSGLKRALKNLGDILLFAFVMLLISLLVAMLRGKRREMGAGLGYAASGLAWLIETVTGIAGKLVLPAMIVTERNFTQSVKQLQEAIKRIPEIATFEVGIRPLTSLVSFLSLGISVLFGMAFGLFTGIILFVLLAITLHIFSTLINQIYYTLLYLTLIEGKKIPGLKLKK